MAGFGLSLIVGAVLATALLAGPVEDDNRQRGVANTIANPLIDASILNTTRRSFFKTTCVATLNRCRTSGSPPETKQISHPKNNPTHTHVRVNSTALAATVAASWNPQQRSRRFSLVGLPLQPASSTSLYNLPVQPPPSSSPFNLPSLLPPPYSTPNCPSQPSPGPLNPSSNLCRPRPAGCLVKGSRAAVVGAGVVWGTCGSGEVGILMSAAAAAAVAEPNCHHHSGRPS
eukprot:196463-Chlamydomonas_euryale.AAC.2